MCGSKLPLEHWQSEEYKRCYTGLGPRGGPAMPVPVARCRVKLFFLLLVLLTLVPGVWPQMVTDPGSGTTTTAAPATTPSNFYRIQSTGTTSVTTTCGDLNANSGYRSLALSLPFFINGNAYSTLFIQPNGYFTNVAYPVGNGVGSGASRCRTITGSGANKPESFIGILIAPDATTINVCSRVTYKWDTGTAREEDFAKAATDHGISENDIAYVIVVTFNNGAGNQYQATLVADYNNFRFYHAAYIGTLSSSVSAGNTFIGYCSTSVSPVTVGSIAQAQQTTNPVSTFTATVNNVNPSANAQGIATANFACRCWEIGKTALPTYSQCPCNQAQVLADTRFTATTIYTGTGLTCSTTSITAGTAICCYDSTKSPTSAQLLSTGFVYVTIADIVAKDDCADGGVTSRFTDLRPTSTCTGYTPPVQSSSAGDPSHLTADGHRFTCSPVGYFNLYTLLNAIVHARYVGRGNGASVIDAVAGRNGTGTVVFEQNSQGALEISVTLGSAVVTITDADFVNNVAQAFGVTITRLPATNTLPVGYVAKFALSNFQIVVRAWSSSATSFLEVVILLDQVLSGQSNSGLIGNFDGVITNDLWNSNGQSISLQSTDRQIYFEVCLSWEVGASNIFPTPTTFEPNPPIFCDERPITDAVRTACGGNEFCECAETALGSGAGSLTLSALESVNNTIELFNNNPATVIGPSSVTGEVGVVSTYSYSGADPDPGQTVTLAASGLPAGSSFVDGELSLLLTGTSAITLVITPTDSIGTVGIPFPVTILICNNNGNGNCRFDTLLDGQSPTAPSQLVASTCDPGYQGDFCELDFDGCAPGIHQCLDDDSCVDASPEDEAMTNNTYTCTACADGIDLIDTQCEDIDECLDATSCEQMCTNNFGSFSCSCFPGFLAANITMCADIDECMLGTHNCAQVCSNTDGTFDCSCHPGFTMTDGMCDEDPNTDTVCSAASCDDMTTTCGVDAVDNTTAVCYCRPGFEMGATANTCMRIDECTSSTFPHDCRSPSTCVDADPGYTCTCPPGYIPDADARGCIACEVGTWGVECSGFCLCLDPDDCDPVTGCAACNPGLTGGSCETDIDECQDPASCPADSTCLNNNGSFACQCDTRFSLNITTGLCIPMNACLDEPCGEFGSCTQLGISYECNCIPGYAGDDCSDNINDCAVNPCQNGSPCVDAINGFYCDCTATPQFFGTFCEQPIPTTTTAPPPVLVDFTGRIRTECDIPSDRTTVGYMTFVSDLEDAITMAVENALAVDATVVISSVDADTTEVIFVVSVPANANLTVAEVVNAIATGLASAGDLRCPDQTTPVTINPGTISVGGVGAVPPQPPNNLPLILGVLLGIGFLVLLTVLIAYCSKRVFSAGHVLVGRRAFIVGGQTPADHTYGRPANFNLRWLPQRMINPAGLASIQPRARPMDNPWAVDPYEPEAEPDETPWNRWRGADNAYYGRAVLRPTPAGNLPALEALPSTVAPAPSKGLMFRNLPGAGGGLRRTGPLQLPSMPAIRLPSMPRLPTIPFFRRQGPVAPQPQPGGGPIYMTPMAMARPAMPLAIGPQMIPMGAMGMAPARPLPARPQFSWQTTSPF